MVEDGMMGEHKVQHHVVIDGFSHTDHTWSHWKTGGLSLALSKAAETQKVTLGKPLPQLKKGRI